MNLSSLARSRACTAVLLATVIVIAYGGSVHNEFVHDDTLFMTMDPRVQSVRLLPSLVLESRWAFRDRNGGQSVDQYYRPLEPLPYAVSHLLFAGAAWPAHVLNLLFHYGNCLLVLALLRRLLDDPTAALAGALLFALHPGYSEAVLWPAALGGLGAFSCTVGLLLLYTGPRADRWWMSAASALLLLCGLWFKETGIVGPCVLVLYDLIGAPDHGARRLWRLRWGYTVFAVPLALYAALRWHALHGFIPGMNYVPLSAREIALNAVALLPQYARMFLWPSDLNLYHDFDAIHSIRTPSFWMGITTVVAATATIARTRRRNGLAAFGVAWALVAVAPYLLVHVPQGNVFAERYLYDPAAGICLTLAYAWTHGRAALRSWQRNAMGAAGAAVLLLFLVLDVRRMLEWRDAVTLYTKTLSQSARAEVVRVNLAVRYLELGRYDDGIAVLNQLLAFAPGYRGAWYNLGLLYQAKGQVPEAISAYENAQRTDPQNSAVLLNLGYLYDQGGRLEDAVQSDLRLVDMAPLSTEGWYNLGVIAFEHGQYENARAALRHVLEHAPSDRQAQALLARLNRLGNSPEADAQTRAATLRRCAVARHAIDIRHPQAAILTLRMAAWLDETSPLPHQYLANAYFLSGNMRAAVAAQREALARAPHNDLYRRNLASLEQILAGQPPEAAGGIGPAGAPTPTRDE